MTFPLESLDLRPFISEQVAKDASPAPLYDLFATSNHVGETDASGHYVANCLHDSTAKWYLFNDSVVTSTSSDELQGPMTYVLFYRLRGS